MKNLTTRDLTKYQRTLLLKRFSDQRSAQLSRISMWAVLDGHKVTLQTSRDIIQAINDNIATDDIMRRHFTKEVTK